MHKLVQYISFLLLVACIAACGGSGSTAASTAYDKSPTTLAPPNTHMGGAIQGTTALVLNNQATVSRLAGTPGIVGFDNVSTANGPTVTFKNPTGVTTDGTNFYVADYNDNAIRQISKDGKTVTLLAGNINGTAGFSDGIGKAATFYHPADITTDGKSLYVTDFDGNSVRKINISIDPVTNTVTNTVTTIGSTTGLAGSVDSTSPAEVRFNHPIGITTDGINVYVSDYGNYTVRRIEIGTNYVTTVAGTPGAIGSTDGVRGAARFNLPGRITTDGTNLYLTDLNNRTIRQIEIATGTVTTIAGSPGPRGTADGNGKDARFNQPNGITTDGTFLYVTDSYENTIRKIDKLSPYIVTTLPIPAGSLHTPIGITTDGESLYVADTSILNIDNTHEYSNSILKIK